MANERRSIKSQRFYLIHNLKASLVSLFNLIVCSLELPFYMHVLSHLDLTISIAVCCVVRVYPSAHSVFTANSVYLYFYKNLTLFLPTVDYVCIVCIWMVCVNGQHNNRTSGVKKSIQIDACPKARKMLAKFRDIYRKLPGFS